MLKYRHRKKRKMRKLILSISLFLVLFSSKAESDFKIDLLESSCEIGKKPYINSDGEVKCKRCPTKGDFQNRDVLFISQGCTVFRHGVYLPREQYLSLIDELNFYREVNNEME